MENLYTTFCNSRYNIVQRQVVLMFLSLSHTNTHCKRCPMDWNVPCSLWLHTKEQNWVKQLEVMGRQIFIQFKNI